MNSLQRFVNTLGFKDVDRVPFFEEGIRQEVLKQWRRQGMPVDLDLVKFFDLDTREEFEVNLSPIPYPRQWPKMISELSAFKKRMNLFLDRRVPKDWEQKIQLWESRDYPLILRVHRGFFLTLGVDGWKRFYDVICLTHDQPDLIFQIMQLQAELSVKLAEYILSRITVDAVLFSEPIGGNHGPLVSPSMYRRYVVPGYAMILDFLRKYKIPVVIMRTYANTRIFLREWVSLGINCLWAVEPPPGKDMNYLDIRNEFGPDLRLIGGIDADALLGDQEDINKALNLIPELLKSGGFIPLLDGRVRKGVSWKNYTYYRRMLSDICTR